MLSALDHAALAECLRIAEREDTEFVKQFAGEPWCERAKSACYKLQFAALALRPWQSPPCLVDVNDTGEFEAGACKLLQKMLAAGLSRFEHDPLAALKKKRGKNSARVSTVV
jgi:hypothetical protein